MDTSYAREDREKVAPLANALEDAGWTVWWGWHIPVGKTWRQVIAEVIEAAKCVLVVWSKFSKSKNWVMEAAEYGLERMQPDYMNGSTSALPERNWM